MRIIKKGATSQSLYFSILDSASTTGGKKTGILFGAAGQTAYYTRNREAAVAITLATLASASAAFSSGGFILVSDANAPGLYRLDVPDLALATGVDSVVITIKGASGAVQVDIEIQLVALDFQDTVRAGLTAIPNVAQGNAGQLPTAGATGLVTLAAATHTGAVIPTVTTLTGHTAQTGDGFARLGAPVGASISADIAAAKANLVTIIAVLGAFTGTGINTVLGFLKAIMSKAASLTPTDVGGTYDNTTDSLEAQKDAGASTDDLGIMLNTTIATLATQTSFTLTAGSANNNAYNGSKVIVRNSTTNTQKCLGVISAYTGATKTVTLQEDPAIFTMAAGDYITILPAAVEVFKRQVDGTVTFEQGQRLQNSAAAGKLSGAATTTVAIRDLADTKDRVSATVDANGNRSAVTRDVT